VKISFRYIYPFISIYTHLTTAPWFLLHLWNVYLAYGHFLDHWLWISRLEYFNLVIWIFLFLFWKFDSQIFSPGECFQLLIFNFMDFMAPITPWTFSSRFGCIYNTYPLRNFILQLWISQNIYQMYFLLFHLTYRLRNFCNVVTYTISTSLPSFKVSRFKLMENHCVNLDYEWSYTTMLQSHFSTLSSCISLLSSPLIFLGFLDLTLFVHLFIFQAVNGGPMHENFFNEPT